MSLTGRSTRDERGRLWALALASGVPLAAYLATASAHGYWLDAGEFVAASVDLDISHPPGHPLAALVGHAATLVPLGPLALRVALASALAAAAAAAFLYLAIERTVRALGVASPWIHAPLSLGATWLVACSHGFWFQAVRPEVYALQALLVCVAIERTVALEAAWPTRDLRPLYVASLAVGLALANHHFLAFLLLPAMAPTLARARRAGGLRPVLTCVGLAAAGLGTYVYLPARSSTDLPLDLGSPDSLGRLYWVVSAQAFQGNQGEGVPQPLWERFADVGVQLVESLHPIPILLALAGAYALLRAPGARRIGVVWIAVLAVFVGARAWLGFVRSNPDALGYLMPALGAVGALAAAFVAAALRLLGRAGQARPRKTAIGVALVVAALGLAQLRATEPGASLAAFAATDAFEELGRRTLPARAVVLVHGPQTLFRVWGAEASERSRPDTTFVPMPFLSYPELVNGLVEREPALSDLLRGYLLDGALRSADLQSLAAERPLLIELDPRVPPSLYRTLVPEGLYFRVLPDEAYEDDRRAAADDRAAALGRLYEQLGRDREDPETAAQLLWQHYMAALYFAATGDRPAARRELALGRAINPVAAELVALEAALGPEGALGPTGQPARGPLDIAPFLPRRLD